METVCNSKCWMRSKRCGWRRSKAWPAVESKAAIPQLMATCRNHGELDRRLGVKGTMINQTPVMAIAPSAKVTPMASGVRMRPNETKMSYGHRERVMIQAEVLKSV